MTLRLIAAPHLHHEMKRRVVEKQYHDLIDKLYSDVTEPRPVTTANFIFIYQIRRIPLRNISTRLWG